MGHQELGFGNVDQECGIRKGTLGMGIGNVGWEWGIGIGDWEWRVWNGVSGMAGSGVGFWEWGVRALSPPLPFPQLDIGTIYSAPGNERVGVALGALGGTG